MTYFSGPATLGVVNGVTPFDHPSNPNHPSVLNVRGHGWMDSSFSYEDDVTLSKEKPLVLRCRFFIHSGAGDPERLNEESRRFSE